MWPYWAAFLISALAASTERAASASSLGQENKRDHPLWIATGFALTLFIGYRFEVGGDWFNYLDHVDSLWGMSLGEALTLPDPGYQILNWLSLQMGWGVFGTNLIGGGIFAFGLVVFCRSLERPRLAFCIAIPYLIIVVAMGYSRQGIALACAMIGLVALQRRSTVKFVAWVMLGATFHKTAVLLLPLGAFAYSQGWLIRVAWISLGTIIGYFLFLAESSETLYAGYIEAEYQSEGALVRLLMNVVPAAILLLKWRQFRSFAAITPIWKWVAWLSLALLVVLFLTPSSTAVDRVALYFLPLQLLVFSTLPDALTPRGGSPRGAVTMILAYYALVLFVWLNFAEHSKYWIPYRFYPLELAF